MHRGEGEWLRNHHAGLDELDSREEVFVSRQRDDAHPDIMPLDPSGVDVGRQSGVVTAIREPQGFVFAELLQQGLWSQCDIHGSGQFLVEVRLVILVGIPEANRVLCKANLFDRLGGLRLLLRWCRYCNREKGRHHGTENRLLRRFGRHFHLLGGLLRASQRRGGQSGPGRDSNALLRLQPRPGARNTYRFALLYE